MTAVYNFVHECLAFRESINPQAKRFQGFSPENVLIIQPKKKPKGKELTEEEKEKNDHEMSSDGIEAETTAATESGSEDQEVSE